MDPKPAPSYDDIVRDAVPLPDSSHRPSRAEANAAEARSPGPHISSVWPDEDDHARPIDVRAALDALTGADLTDLAISLDGGRAILGGSVATQEDRDRIVRAVAAVEGVATVIDTLRVRL